MSRTASHSAAIAEASTPTSITSTLDQAIAALATRVEASGRIAIWDTLEISTDIDEMESRTAAGERHVASYRTIRFDVTTVSAEEVSK